MLWIKESICPLTLLHRQLLSCQQESWSRWCARTKSVFILSGNASSEFVQLIFRGLFSGVGASRPVLRRNPSSNVQIPDGSRRSATKSVPLGGCWAVNKLVLWRLEYAQVLFRRLEWLPKRFPLASCQRDHNWQLHKVQRNFRRSPSGLSGRKQRS